MSQSWNLERLTRGRHEIVAVDLHTAGEPLRLVLAGLPLLDGSTMNDKRACFRRRHDHLRTALMLEPRGHDDMYGAVLTEPVTDDGDYGILFLHNEGYSTMCGHGIIAVATALAELDPPVAQDSTPVYRFDTPAGRVTASVHRSEDDVTGQVTFENVASYVVRDECEVTVPELGRIKLSVAFGGAYYAIVDVTETGMKIRDADLGRLVMCSTAIKRAVEQSVEIQHPVDSSLSFLYGVIYVDLPEDEAHHSRNLCVFADREVDRSPTGTGVSARLALHHARGEIDINESITIESCLGAESVFSGRVVAETEFADRAAVIPEVSGQAFITGIHRFLIDERDQLGAGFRVPR